MCRMLLGYLVELRISNTIKCIAESCGLAAPRAQSWLPFSRLVPNFRLCKQLVWDIWHVTTAGGQYVGLFRWIDVPGRWILNSIPFHLPYMLEEQRSSFCSSKLVCSRWLEGTLTCVNSEDSTLLEPRSWILFFFCAFPPFCISCNINKLFWSNCHQFLISGAHEAVLRRWLRWHCLAQAAARWVKVDLQLWSEWK